MSSLDFKNKFSVRSIDLDTFDFPAPEVKSWTPLFGGGEGSVTIEAMTAGGYRVTLWEEAGHKPHLRSEANDLLAEWMEDNRGNWLRVIEGALKYVHEHNVKQAKEYAAAKKVSAAAIKRLAELKEAN